MLQLSRKLIYHTDILIETKIPYLKLLNVDYLWINPIYESGGKDCGYDIKDYLTIDNKFGSLDDFKQLIMILKNNKIKLQIVACKKSTIM